MNTKAKKFVKNFSYTFTSNLLSLLISTILILIVPKLIGVEEYGYWQLYLFYSTYVGFLHFGWSDGIYLRYGGQDYSNLNKNLLFSQFYMLAVMQIIIGIIIYCLSLYILVDENKFFVIIMIIICMLISNIKSIPLFILQGTSRIKEYAYITISGQFFYFGIVVFLLLIGIRDFKSLIIADLIGKLISLIYTLYFCKTIVFLPLSTFKVNLKEMYENITVGIKVVFAYIAGLLLIGVVRFGVERSWDIATFGQLSLILSITKLFMVFVNAVGIILFPILKKTNDKMLPNIYVILRDLLMILLFLVLVIYYPLYVLLTYWLPSYASSLIYLVLLFPIIIFEGKVALLINTYFKTLRREQLMLKINLVALIFSVCCTILTTVIFKDLVLAIFSILIILGFRSILSEILLAKILGISINKDILLEISLIIVFVVSGWFIKSWYVSVIYFLAYIFYIILKRKDIFKMFKNLKLLISR